MSQSNNNTPPPLPARPQARTSAPDEQPTGRHPFPTPVPGYTPPAPPNVSDMTQPVIQSPYAAPLPSTSGPVSEQTMPVIQSPYQMNPTPTGGFVATSQITGQFSIDQLQAPSPAPGANQFSTGSFGAIAPSTTGAFSSVEARQQSQPVTLQLRLRAGLWGSAIGAIFGLILGGLNALFEGVPLAQLQKPLIILMFVGMFSVGGTCVAVPKKMETFLRNNNILRR